MVKIIFMNLFTHALQLFITIFGHQTIDHIIQIGIGIIILVIIIHGIPIQYIDTDIT